MPRRRRNKQNNRRPRRGSSKASFKQVHSDAEIPSTASADTGFGRRQRIPVALQKVFLASNRGQDVKKAPKEASQTYLRRGFSRMSRAFGLLSFRKTPPGSPNNRTMDDCSATSTTSRSSRTQVPIDPKASPQEYLEAELARRNYATTTYKTLDSAYRNQPTQLQKASYDAYLIDLAKLSASKTFSSVLHSGISPNPCNRYGESLLHLVCRLGNSELLNVMIDAGADLQVSDDYGRTPLHDACWGSSPSFELVETLLLADVNMLFLKDARGSLPLTYVPKNLWDLWKKFLSNKLDDYFPKAIIMTNAPPPLTLQRPNSRPVPNPVNALSVEMARLVCSGRLRPEEAIMLMEEGSSSSEEEDYERFTYEGNAGNGDDDDDQSTSSEGSSSSSSSSMSSSDYSSELSSVLSEDDFTLRGLDVKVPTGKKKLSHAELLRQTEELLKMDREIRQRVSSQHYVEPDSPDGLLAGAC